MGYLFTFGLALLVQIAVTTGILSLSLWILSDDRSSPFQEYGVSATWIRCAGLVVVNILIGFVFVFAVESTGSFLVGIAGSVISLVCWFVGIMALFERTFGQAFLLTLACEALGWMLGHLMSMVLN